MKKREEEVFRNDEFKELRGQEAERGAKETQRMTRCSEPGAGGIWQGE